MAGEIPGRTEQTLQFPSRRRGATAEGSLCPQPKDSLCSKSPSSSLCLGPRTGLASAFVFMKIPGDKTCSVEPVQGGRLFQGEIWKCKTQHVKLGSACAGPAVKELLSLPPSQRLFSSPSGVFGVTSEGQEMRGVNPRHSEDNQGCFFCLCLSLFFLFFSFLSWRDFFTRNHV